MSSFFMFCSKHVSHMHQFYTLYYLILPHFFASLVCRLIIVLQKKVQIRDSSGVHKRVYILVVSCSHAVLLSVIIIEYMP